MTFRPARSRRRCGHGLRPLRSRVGAGRRRARQARRPADRRRRHGLRQGRIEHARAQARRAQRRRGPVCRAMAERPQPLAVAGGQSGDRVHRIARDRPVRRRDSIAGVARRADAHRRQHRRQYRQPDHGARHSRRWRSVGFRPAARAACSARSSASACSTGSCGAWSSGCSRSCCMPTSRSAW